MCTPGNEPELYFARDRSDNTLAAAGSDGDLLQSPQVMYQLCMDGYRRYLLTLFVPAVAAEHPPLTRIHGRASRLRVSNR